VPDDLGDLYREREGPERKGPELPHTNPGIHTSRQRPSDKPFTINTISAGLYEKAGSREKSHEGVERARNRETVERNFLQSHKEHLGSRIKDVRGLASELRQQLEHAGRGEMRELRDIADLTESTCDYWEVQLSALVNDRDPQAALALSLSLEARIHGLEDFLKLYRELASEGDQQAPLHKVKAGRLRQAGQFLDLLLSIRRDLWALIAGLLTPKEWTLKGSVQVPMLADAGIEIKFGPRRDESR
jgi:hypothetical protein